MEIAGPKTSIFGLVIGVSITPGQTLNEFVSRWMMDEVVMRHLPVDADVVL